MNTKKQTCETCKHYIPMGISKTCHKKCGRCDKYEFYMVLASDNVCDDWEPI